MWLRSISCRGVTFLCNSELLVFYPSVCQGIIVIYIYSILRDCCCVMDYGTVKGYVHFEVLNDND